MSAVRAPAAVDLAAVVGSDHVREAADRDAVQGVRPALVVEPADEAEVAAVLREASGRGLAVVARGAGTKLAWGAPPRRCEVVLSTLRLDALVEHQPADLICVAEAGMRLGALRAELDRARDHRQRLMLDPPQGDSATLGGIVATAAGGPLRARCGTARELLLGVRFVLADGTVGHAGGKVVKNVAGYDMGRLLTGSLGTLAVITQLAFKLHPLPAASRTVVVERASPTRLAELVRGLRGLAVAPAAVEVAWPEALAAIRIDSSERGAREQAELVARESGGRVAPADEASELWRRLGRSPWAGAGAVAGVAVPRARLAGLLEACSDFAVEAAIRGELAAGEVRLPADPAAVGGMRAAVERLGGGLVLHRATGELAGLCWPGAGGVEVELMRSLKRTLDPGGVLAPGRQLGGI